MGGHRHGGDLGLVAHLGQEEGDQRGAEHAQALGHLGLFLLDLVGDHGPHCHADEGQAQHPAQDLRAHVRSDPGAHGPRQAMVHQGGDEDPHHDGQRFLETRRQQEGEQLGLVADFGQGDDAGGDEEGFHSGWPPRGERWLRREVY